MDIRALEICSLAGILNIGIALRLGWFRYAALTGMSGCSYWLQAMNIFFSHVHRNVPYVLGYFVLLGPTPHNYGGPPRCGKMWLA